MKHFHLVGIGGTGLSAIARVLLESGYIVSGSDQEISPLARNLTDLGVHITKGHHANNINQDMDIVIRSSAVPESNPEIIAAQNYNIPVLKRSEFLGQLLAQKDGIAIAGTHGKTTTTAMVAWMLTFLNQDPSYIIGGSSKNLGNNAHAGSGSHFVIEADEYDNMFLGLKPSMAIITNIEHDHPDCFPTPELYFQAFDNFVSCLNPEGLLLICGDDPGAMNLSNRMQIQSKMMLYGIQKNGQANYLAQNIIINPVGCYDFEVWFRHNTNEKRVRLAAISLQVPGEHNVQNAVAALAAAHQLNLPLTEAAKSLSAFTGTGRRFDVRGTAAGITIIDDYAHHPVEIQATLTAARNRFPGQRLWAVWQPHTYSRTQMFQEEFIQALDLADQIIITEVYAAREDIKTFSAAQIVDRISPQRVFFAQTLDHASGYLLSNLIRNDVVLVLSAGDAIQISEYLFATLSQKESGKKSTPCTSGAIDD